MISLDKAYNRESFVKFLEDNFLPEDFHRDYEKISLSGSQNFASEACRLGECKSLELEVFEVHHNSLNDARVGIAKDAFRMLLNHSYCNRALVAFVPGDGKQWRFSLLQMDADLSENNRIKRSYSNPRRYSFLLGESSAIKTPTQFLIEKGRIRDRQEGTKHLSPFEDLVYRFSVETLTKQFYNELFGWYLWAVDSKSGIYFPNDTTTADDDFEDTDKKIIRLLTRLMFVWFIKQKDLVPGSLFDEDDLKHILKNFDPQATNDGCYYNAILQNLFFATLNRAIDGEDGKRGFAKLQGQRDIKTLYRYSEMFCISEADVIKLFATIPFLNGGLFECLDKTKKIDGVEKAFNYDGFSRNDKQFANGRYRQRAFIPNKFFFDSEKGLLNILKKYNFTIEENTPAEQTVALDPELLGKVFENLLGAYNPETKETARNQSGSFYTPREIVSYMVDESLIAYLGDTPLVRSMFKDDFEPDELHWSDYQLIAGKLKSVKVFDPACGSGAFPMGLLNRIVDLLKKIEADKTTYELKLNIIENCIYGSDIQNIAAQITKLRFFISLICDCEKDVTKPNFGIPTLPNLETKFVTADSLVGLKKIKKGDFTGTLFEDPEIEETKHALQQIRHDHFIAKTASLKNTLRKKDHELREKLASLLSADNDFAPEDAKQMASWNPYDQNAVSPFFDSEWMFGVTDGFDIVIGNPPYIQLQNNNGALAELYESCGFETFTRTGDIYCLFYERGHQLLKQNGHLCYITSNKWMRAGYGEKTRQFFATKTDPQLLVDFAGVKIFESATVDTNILLFQKTTNKKHTICAVTKSKDKDNIKELSDYVKSNNSSCSFTNSDSWVILSQIEQSIKNKIETVGTPLRDWNINIYRGVLTGYNEAFIIDTTKRDEILANCKNEAERQRTTELIRPILRGRDIKRYGYDWAGLWLINTHNGIKGKYPPIDINDYPAIKQHLDLYWDKIKKRDDRGITPYNLRNCAYMDDFFKPKICWKAVGRNLTFAIVESGTFLTAPASFIQAGQINEYILAFLCSNVGRYFIYQNSDTTGAGDIMLNIQSLIKFPIPIKSDYTKQISCLVLKQQNHYSQQTQNEIDDIIYKIYGFNNDEITEIENC